MLYFLLHYIQHLQRDLASQSSANQILSPVPFAGEFGSLLGGSIMVVTLKDHLQYEALSYA